MSEHTPGPWHVNTKAPEQIWSNGVRIAEAIHWPNHDAEANARLIAAAPDLLAQLEAFVELANDWFSKMPEDWKARYICANEVIAQAKQV